MSKQTTELQDEESLLSRLMLGAALGISVFFVFSWLDSVPGLHADEAFVGLRAHDILKGERPILGMNGYTGSIHQYFAALALGVFGFKVWALRAFGATTSALSVCLYYLCIKRLSNPRLAALSALILSTMPFFVGFSRIANEVFMLNPILSLGSIYLLLKANDGYPALTKKLFYFYSGVLIGIGIWAHVIFLSFMFALGVASLMHRGSKVFTTSALYFMTAGGLIALSPRVYYQIVSHDPVKSSIHPFEGMTSRFHEWPNVFIHVLHGDEIFQRFTGAILWNPPMFSSYLWIVSVLALAYFAVKKGIQSFEFLILSFSIPLIIATLAMSPGNAERYLLLPLYTTPLFIAYLLWRSKSIKLFYLLVTLFSGFQVTLVGINYFHSFLSTGGQNSMFGLGEEVETSNHYINTNDLFGELEKIGATQVCSEFFISAPLNFYKLSTQDSFEISSNAKDCQQNDGPPRLGVYAVIYKLGKRIINVRELPGFTPVSSDTHFLILQPRSGE